MTSENFQLGHGCDYFFSKDEINDFLFSLLGSNHELIKVVYDYLSGDVILADFQHALPKELWEYLETCLTSRPETDKLCTLLCVLKRKAKENIRCHKKELDESGFLPDYENDSEDRNYCRIIEHIFIKCLEKCLSEVQNIFDRMKIEEEMLGSSEKGELTDDTESSCRPTSMNERDSICNTTELRIQKDKVENRFFVILSYSDIETLNEELTSLFAHTLQLIYEKKYLDLYRLYLTLFCASESMLLKFSVQEATYTSSIDFSSYLYKQDKWTDTFKWRLLFLFSIRRRKHLASVFFEQMIKNFPLNLPSDDAVEQSVWCLPLYFVAYIHHWSLSQDKLALLPSLESAFSKFGDKSDPIIQSLCIQKIKHMKLTQWCSQYKPSINVNKLLTLLQSHSSLYAIQASIPLSNLPYQGFLELLLKDNQGESSMDRMNRACAATYQSYYILLITFHIIMAGIEMDKVVLAWRERMIQGKGILNHRENSHFGNFDIEDSDLNACKSYYKTHIVKKWQTVKKILNEIQPLEYRLEILEDLFSLLFLKHTNLSDEGQEDSIMEESEQLSPVSLKPEKEEAVSISSLISSSSRGQFGSSYKAAKSNNNSVKADKLLTFYDNGEETVPDEDSMSKRLSEDIAANAHPPLPSPGAENPREWARPPLMLLTSTNSEFSTASSVGDFSSCGYIMNTLVAWDLLLLLKEALAKLQAAILSDVGEDEACQTCILSSVGRSEFFDRFNLLERRVKDGLWRLKVALPQQRELGSDQQMGDFMRGTLYSSMSSVIHYEPDAHLEEEEPETHHERKRHVSTNLKSHRQVYKERESITNFLLSSPRDLLSIALMNNNLKAGQDILTKYNLESSKEKQELVLMQCLKENIPKIEAISRIKSKEVKRRVSIEGSPQSSAKKLESEIQTSSHDVAISTLIDQTLNLSVAERGRRNDHPSTEVEEKISLTVVVDEDDDKQAETECEEKNQEIESPWVDICPKLILLDIALTSSISEENASKLFTVALGQELFISNESASQSSVSIPFIHEYFKNLPQLTELSQVMDSIKKSKPKKSILKEGNQSILKILLAKPINPSNLLLSKSPLNKEDFDFFQTAWIKLLTSIATILDECWKTQAMGTLNGDLAEETRCQSRNEDTGNDNENKDQDTGIKTQNSDEDFSLLFEDILATLSDKNICKSVFSLPQSGEEMTFDYLSSFINYLQVLKSITTKHTPTSFDTKSCLHLLNQRPNVILGDLIFNRKIDPYQLEMEFQYIELDMLSVIIKYVSYPFYNVHHSKSLSFGDDQIPSLESLGCLYTDGVYVLNANQLLCSKPVFGDLLVSDLLFTLLDNLRDTDFNNPDLLLSLSRRGNNVYLTNPHVKTLLLECSELCCIDMLKLKEEYEILVFYINLANLMFIHAVLLNCLIYEQEENNVGLFSKSKMEQIIAMKRVGYLVGQLGFVSLYDLIFKILKQPLIYDTHNVTNSSVLSLMEMTSCSSENPLDVNLNMLPEPLLIFSVSQGLSPSPKIGIFYSDTFNEELNTAVTDYFTQVIMPNLQNNLQSLDMNPVLFTFLSTHPTGWDDAVKSLKDILGETEDPTIPLYLEWLEKLNEKNSNLRVTFTLTKLFIEYSDMADVLPSIENTEATKNGKVVQPSPLTPLILPSLCAAYINDNCPILNTLLQAFHLAVHEDASTQSDREILGKDEPDISFLNNFFKVSKIYHSNIPCIKSNYEKSKVIASLPFEDYYPSIICRIENILSGIPQEDFLSRNLNASKSILKIVDILSEFPSIVCQNHFILSYIWDSIMAYLSTFDASAAIPHPWSFVFHVQNASLRFRMIQDNFIKWRVDVTLRCLRYLECEGYLAPAEKEFVKNKIEQMTIYSQIMKLPKERLCLETCQEVLRSSLESPEDLMNHLVQQRQFSLALRWVESHGLKERFYPQAINTSLLQCLDVPDPDFKRAETILNSVSSVKLEKTIGDLLKNVNVHSTRKFVMKYFLERIGGLNFSKYSASLKAEEQSLQSYSSLEAVGMPKLTSLKVEEKHSHPYLASPNVESPISSSYLASLRQELMGIVLIEDVAPKTFNRSQLFSLISRPGLILEQWIMNLKLDAVEKAVSLIAPILDCTPCVDTEEVNPPDDANTGKQPTDDVRERSPISDPDSLQTCSNVCFCWDHYHSMIEKYAFKSLEISGIQVALKHSFKVEADKKQFVIPFKVPLKAEWQKNSSVSICPVCQTSMFSLFCRRHHCRRCGRVVCASCSMNRISVQGYGDVPVRVCGDCFAWVTHRFPLQALSPTARNPSITDSIGNESEGTGTSSLSEAGWYFSTEAYHNQRVREEFSFDYAPSLSLCQAILALHKADDRAAICILKLSHKMLKMAIDAFSAPFSEVDPSFVLQITRTLVTSAKLRFGKLLNYDGISLCEYYLQWLGFLQLLLKARCTSLLPPGALHNMLEVGLMRRSQLSDSERVDVLRIQQKLEQERRFLRVLRDNLVKREMWDLALDISTKAGFETSGVWGAFAMAALKAGDFALAREHFSKVLMKPRDKNLVTKSAVLEEIVFYLENCHFSTQRSESLEEETPLQGSESLDERSSYFSVGMSSAATPSDPVVITQILSNLVGFTREVSRTDMCDLNRILPAPASPTHSLSSLQQRECEYYLRLYGSHRAYLQFLVRHSRTKDAVIYARESDVDEKVFTDEILLPSFKKSRFNRVWVDILEADPKQTWISPIMYRSCKYLEKTQYLHCLLEVQKALSDRLRAAMTLIRLYIRDADSYSELIHRTHYLMEASSHLQSYLDVIPLNEGSLQRKSRHQKTPKRLSHICLKSTGWHVNRQINLSAFQRDVTKYLADLETSGTNFRPVIESIRKVIRRSSWVKKRRAVLRGGDSSPSNTSGSDESPPPGFPENSLPIPTVFTKEDCLIVCAVVMCVEGNVTRNLSLVYRLVEMNSVSPKDLLSITLQTKVARGSTAEMGAILEGVLEWGLIPGSQVRSIIWPSITAAPDDVPDSVFRDMSKFLISPRDKMDLFVEVGLMKLAYSQVNEKGTQEDIEALREAATRREDKTVAFYCTKWLQNLAKKGKTHKL